MSFRQKREAKNVLSGKPMEGFTLIEMLVVVAIIGILAAMAIPNILDWLPHYRINAAANALKADIHLAHNLAIKKNQSYCMVVTSETQYLIRRNSGANKALCESDDPIWQSIDYNGRYIKDGNTVESRHYFPGVKITAGAPTLILEPQGTIKDPGIFTLSITDRKGNIESYVVESFLTGLVEVIKQ